MHLTRLYSTGLNGLESFLVTIEVGLDSGFGFRIVGLADSAIRESYHRIRSCLGYLGKRMPGKKIVVNLGPAHRRKTGSAYDLPMAIGILMASGQMHHRRPLNFVFLGELSLDGKLKPVQGLLAQAMSALEAGFKDFVVPRENAPELWPLPGARCYPADSLQQVIDFLELRTELNNTPSKLPSTTIEASPDTAQIHGQPAAIRALEVAAAGGHHLLLLGPEGTGKSLLAERLPFLLPPLESQDSLEVARIHSAAGLLQGRGFSTDPPVRKPHHSIGRAAFLGGGATPTPGELTLAHRGVLIMDELQLFGRELLNLMRGPLEERRIRINRLKYACDFPCSFLLVGTANLYSSKTEHDYTRRRGAGEILGSPLLDRMELQIFMDHPLKRGSLQPGPCSREIRERVIRARRIQRNRFPATSRLRTNAEIPAHILEAYCALGTAQKQWLDEVVLQLGFSLRARDHLIRIARTLADLGGSETISEDHLAEAVQFRDLDRQEKD